MTDSIIITTETITNIVSNDINTSSVIVSATQGPAGAQGPPGASESNVTKFVTDNTINTQLMDSFSYTTYGSAKYIIYITNGNSRQICELLVLHDNITPVFVEYANMVTTAILATFTVDILDGFVRILTTPTNIHYNFTIYRTLLPA